MSTNKTDSRITSDLLPNVNKLVGASAGRAAAHKHGQRGWCGEATAKAARHSKLGERGLGGRTGSTRATDGLVLRVDFVSK